MQATTDGPLSKTRLDIYLATSLKSRQINFGPQILFKVVPLNMKSTIVGLLTHMCIYLVHKIPYKYMVRTYG